MNAYELADSIITCTTDPLHKQSADMLRQQADELNTVIPKLVKANGIIENLRIRIAELELALHTTLTNRSLRTYDGKSLQNHVDAVNTSQECVDKTENNRHEPVAWMNVEPDGRTALATYQFETAIPLYTTPQTKPLSDDEINMLVVQKLETWNTKQAMIDFARAIEERILGK